jgi:hypothetical protein
MALNGPSVAFYIVADGLEWAQIYIWETLPITSDGPLGISTDGLEWAQHSSL